MRARPLLALIALALGCGACDVILYLPLRAAIGDPKAEVPTGSIRVSVHCGGVSCGHSGSMKVALSHCGGGSELDISHPDVLLDDQHDYDATLPRVEIGKHCLAAAFMTTAGVFAAPETQTTVERDAIARAELVVRP